ncbi:MAG: hypothetical protein IJP27_09575 [Clostridia bacterium]|nr:hypothetical protein [Clostridia bacterium]
MEREPLKYTFFPWMDSLTVGKIVPIAVGLLIAYCLFEYFFKKYNNSMRKGTLAIISATVWTMLLNICFFTVAYWRWAFLFSIALGIFFIIIVLHELKVSYQDELEGYRGLNPLIRGIRAEIFADLSIEEQMEFKKTVTPQKFYWFIWLPLVVILPFLIILLLEQLGVGDYLFNVVYFETP